MAADDQPDEAAAPVSRPAPRKPDSNTEKALTLEVARLFGMSPKALLHRDTSPEEPSPAERKTSEEDGEADADAAL